MQASLPRMIRMVSVEDIGQGSESIRILGVKWLPTGAAAKSVTEDGKLKSGDEDPRKSDRTVPGQGELQEDPNSESQENHEEQESKPKRQQDMQEDENVAEGMEAEEGDFVNLEIAFAYRARATGRSIRKRAKNIHLYLGFYMPANIKLRK